MQQKNKIKIAVLPGDGVGQDVTHSALPVFDALGIPVDLTQGDIGWSFWKKEGTPIPERTWSLIREADATLLGAITSKPEREALQELAADLQGANLKYVSPVIQLRQQLDLYLNIRPCHNIKSSTKAFNFCVIRENTEGLYAGFDYHPIPSAIHSIIREKERWRNTVADEVACSLRLQSKSGLLRLYKYAFEYAQRENLSKVTLADKPNVLRQSSALARNLFESVANQYPSIQAEILNVDAVALWLVRRPEDFGVIVAENMFGDILSDLGAGVMGGLGFAPSANIGDKGCYFEPVHGSAPRVKPDKANPSAMFMTISLLLKQFGLHEASQKIQTAVRNVIKNGHHLTYDLGGAASTNDMANAIIDQCLQPSQTRNVSLLATGSELLSGDIQDSNSHDFSKKISEMGGTVFQSMQVSDHRNHMVSAINYLLEQSDAIVLTGGLGPTSDDNTRYAISDLIKSPLTFEAAAWDHVVARLNKFNLAITDSNKAQALFPKGATLYVNKNGTAWGCHLQWKNKHIFMLPGPPKECGPMFDQYVLPELTRCAFFQNKKIKRWLTLGLIEGEIAPEIDQLVAGTNVETAYRWAYPYLEIKIIYNKKVETTLFDKINLRLANNTVTTEFVDAITTLKAVLDRSSKQVVVSLNSFLEFETSLLQHSKLTFIKNNNCNLADGMVFQLEIKDISKQGQSILGMSVTGYVDGKLDYTHALSTPNRGAEIHQYVSAYLAWQLSKFILAN